MTNGGLRARRLGEPPALPGIGSDVTCERDARYEVEREGPRSGKRIGPISNK